MNKLELIKALLNEENSQPSERRVPFQIGDKILACTVTRYFTGRVANVLDRFIQLEDAAWIADTGRYMSAIENGTFNEIEPIFGEHWVNMDTIVDFTKLSITLPRKQK